MPKITAKAAAELLSLPAYEQLRIITEQKHPRREPTSYRTPFYQPASVAIKRFFRQGNEPSVIAEAKRNAESLRPDSKRVNNLRVLNAFEASAQYTRQLDIRPAKEFATEIDDVIIRLAPDMLVREDGEPKVVFFNFRTVAIPSELARVTLEIAHWIMEECQCQIPLASFEYVDLVEQRVHAITNRRQKTIRQLQANAHVIQALWDSV